MSQYTSRAMSPNEIAESVVRMQEARSMTPTPKEDNRCHICMETFKNETGKNIHIGKAHPAARLHEDT